MRYYSRKYNSRKWKKIGNVAAIREFIKRRNWDSCRSGWHLDMLSVPNVIQCADSEILVIGDEGARPVEGYKNIRRDEYYELIRIKVTTW